MKNTQVYADQYQFLNGFKVLLVDNSADCVEYAKTVLQEFGISVKVASSVREALDIIANEKIDCLISEIAISIEDGYSLIHKIRMWEKYQNLQPIPAIALTAYCTKKGCFSALNAGYQVYTTKPIYPSDLLNCIAYLAR
ncbi:MAG TPA: response regulator [Nostocaceae cyanobacterium]|nr:response regulator [Nostocaceae cyanobacterium]